PGASLGAATYEQRVIAGVIAGEASNQGRAGVTHGNRRGTYAFSCLNRTTPPALVRKWHSDPSYETALKLAQLLCETPEKLPDTTRSANFFTQVGEKPEWARGRKPVVVIKDHAFYRIPANAGSR